jgi:glycosyltransferase involved in cell wall biosynthesis
MPVFSVLITVYNHASWLKERIESVLQQDFQDFEVIILDNHSTDGSSAIIEQYRTHPKVTHIILNEQNTGRPVTQWKQGLDLAQGTWIWIAEGDDFADPGFLSACKKSIENNPSLGLWYCDSNILDATTNKIIRRFSDRRNGIFKTIKWDTAYCQQGIKEINECLKYDCTVNNMSAAVFKKEIIAPLLTILPPYIYYADWWLCLQVCFQAEICYHPEALSTYRRHSQNFSSVETSLFQTKGEYFEILKLLYHQDKVSDKKQLINHFAYNYLSYSFFKDGMGKGSVLLKKYFASDRKLAAIVFNSIVGSRIFPSFYKKNYELKDPAEKSVKL